jgi:hypothetical protein
MLLGDPGFAARPANVPGGAVFAFSAVVDLVFREEKRAFV